MTTVWVVNSARLSGGVTGALPATRRGDLELRYGCQEVEVVGVEIEVELGELVGAVREQLREGEL